MKILYHKHKCSSLIPLLLLIIIDFIAFEHIVDVFSFVDLSTQNELFVFIFSLTLTYYYLCKHHSNIRAYYKWLKHKIKGEK
mgnify:FL=1